MSIGATIGCVCLVISAARRLRPAPLTGPEHAVASVGLALAVASLLATLLALFGWLGGVSLGAGCVVLFAADFALPSPPARDTMAVNEAGRARWILLALLLLGVGLRALPMDNPLGGRDPGSYTLRTQQTLRSGTLDHHDELLAQASRVQAETPRAGLEDLLGSYPVIEEGVRVDRYEAPYRPGFYLADRDTGRVEAQFFHLYPGTLATAGLVFGPERLHFISPLIATLLLGVWACVAVRAFEGWSARVGALGLIALSPLAIWTSRQTLSEGVYGLWLSLALLLCLAQIQAERRARIEVPLAAGLLLGCATWVRGDAWVWAPLLAVALWGRHRRPRDGAPLFIVVFALGVALHAHTSFAYLHDELLRRWPGVETPEPRMLSVAALLGAGIWLLVDRVFASKVQSERSSSPAAIRAMLALTLALLGVYLQARLRSGGTAPYSRLDPLIVGVGSGWLVASFAGLLLLAQPERARSLRPTLAFVLIVLASVVLFVPRQLPNAGLYYYGRYLTPVVLPAMALLAGLAIESLNHRNTKAGASLAVLLLGMSAWPLLSSAQTLMRERPGAAEAVERIAAQLPSDAIVIAGGDGWHRGFTFNQIAGALQMREGIEVLPYRDRQRTYAVALDLLRSGVGDAPPPVFLLINEASHHYTRPDDARIVAGADDLLSAPLRARSVHHFEFWLDYLTPDREALPRRITRDGMRMSLIELELGEPPATTRFAGGKAEGGPLRFARRPSAKRWKEGRLCLHPKKALALEFESPDPRGGEFFVEMHPGTPSQNVAVALRVDGAPVSVHAPERGSPPRGSLGPFPFSGGKHRLELRGGELEGSGPCPRGGVASISLLPPPQRAGSDLEPGRHDALSLHRGPKRDHPVKHSDWTSAQALTRFRSGLDPKAEVHGLSLRVHADRALSFPSAWLPGVDRSPETSDYDVIITLTAMRLSEGAKVRLRLDEATVQDSEPPRDRRGSWQTPKLRWSSASAQVEAKLELVDAQPGDFVDVRDISFFVRDRLVTSVRNPP